MSAEWRGGARPQLAISIQPAAGSAEIHREKHGGAARWRKKKELK